MQAVWQDRAALWVDLELEGTTVDGVFSERPMVGYPYGLYAVAAPPEAMVWHLA